jgi:hypothetical protein
MLIHTFSFAEVVPASNMWITGTFLPQPQAAAAAIAPCNHHCCCFFFGSKNGSSLL